MSEIHVYVHAVSDPAVTDRLDLILRKIGKLSQKEDMMSKELDDAVVALTASSVDLTSTLDSLVAFIQANATAQLELAAEKEAEGVDATAIRELANAQIANKDRIAALILANTPAAVRIPPVVPTA